MITVKLNRERDRLVTNSEKGTDRSVDSPHDVEPFLNGMRAGLERAHGSIADATWDVIRPELTRSIVVLAEHFGGIHALNGLKVLDLGCGNTSRRDEPRDTPRRYEPWFCRAMALAGCDAHGADLGPGSPSDVFRLHVTDLSQRGALSVFGDASIDCVHSTMFTNSPSFLRSEGSGRAIEHLHEEAARIVKPGGLVALFDWPNPSTRLPNLDV